jgi:4-hydroxybenzoyl-CoA reductase subunit alpha
MEAWDKRENYVREGKPSYLDERRFTQIGRSVPKVDAPGKAKGEAIYTDDMVFPGMLYAKIKRCKEYAHANIKKIDCSKALALPGVMAVLTGDEAPNKWGIVPASANETALAVGKVRFYGEGVAAVAAIDEETAEAACDLIEVEYEPLPALLDPFESMARADEVLIHEDKPGNILHKGDQIYGDVDKAFEKCEYILAAPVGQQPGSSLPAPPDVHSFRNAHEQNPGYASRSGRRFRRQGRSSRIRICRLPVGPQDRPAGQVSFRA